MDYSANKDIVILFLTGIIIAIVIVNNLRARKAAAEKQAEAERAWAISNLNPASPYFDPIAYEENKKTIEALGLTNNS